MNAALKTLLDNLNAQIKAFNDNNFKIYDADNRDYCITEIAYCEKDDKLIATFKEE